MRRLRYTAEHFPLSGWKLAAQRKRKEFEHEEFKKPDLAALISRSEGVSSSSVQFHTNSCSTGTMSKKLGSAAVDGRNNYSFILSHEVLNGQDYVQHDRDEMNCEYCFCYYI